MTLAFTGDIHFEDDVRARLADPSTTLAPIADAPSAADVTVVNLETAVTECGAPEPKTYEATSGVLTFTVREGSVVDDSWTPTFAGQDGMPQVVTGAEGERATAEWAALRDCSGLAGSLDGAEAMS